MGDKPMRCVSQQPDDGCIDIPHTPDAESALFMEAAERISMLKGHTADPGVVEELNSISSIMVSMAQTVHSTEEYNCDCNLKLLENE